MVKFTTTRLAWIKCKLTKFKKWCMSMICSMEYKSMSKYTPSHLWSFPNQPIHNTRFCPFLLWYSSLNMSCQWSAEKKYKTKLNCKSWGLSNNCYSTLFVNSTKVVLLRASQLAKVSLYLATASPKDRSNLLASKANQKTMWCKLKLAARRHNCRS